MNRLIVTTVLLGGVLLAGCRGMQSDDPPFHPNLNMDFQERFEAQEANALFADNRAMRPLVPGTVARGLLRGDTRFYLGREESGEYVENLPVPLTRELLQRGQERYDIYCAVCHSLSGNGRGIIMTGNYGYTPAPSYHDQRLLEVPDGYLYEVIVNGVRSMPPYAHQVPVADRWAIVAYIRALQRSQRATPEDVPQGVLTSLATRPERGVGEDTSGVASTERPDADSLAIEGPAPLDANQQESQDANQQEQ